MTSWGGTSMVTVRRSTLIILSRMGTRKKSPGPLAPLILPREKMTPRSYSLTMGTALPIRNSSTTTAMTAATAMPKPATCNNPKLTPNTPLSGPRRGRLPGDPAPPQMIVHRAPRRARERGEAHAGLPLERLPDALLLGLEQPPRAHVTRDGVYGRLGDDPFEGRGVDGGAVTRGDADVGYAAAALGPEDQVAGSGRPRDRRAHAVLGGRRVGQGDAERRVDEHRVAGAVLPDPDLAGSGGREHVGRAHVRRRLGDHVAPRTGAATGGGAAGGGGGGGLRPHSPGGGAGCGIVVLVIGSGRSLGGRRAALGGAVLGGGTGGGIVVLVIGSDRTLGGRRVALGGRRVALGVERG